MKQNIIILVLGILVLSLVFYSGRLTGEAQGKLKAETECAEKIIEYREALNRQTEVLNAALQIESVDLSKEVTALTKDTQDIKKQLKNQPQPLVLINSGECLASQTALDARRKMIERVNK